MAAPAGVAIRVIVLRYGIAVARVVARHATKRAITKKMRRKPDPPQRQSRGVEHTASSGTTRGSARKSMRGPSALRSRSGRRKSTYFRRDEERY
jgi:hypothetical protein